MDGWMFQWPVLEIQVLILKFDLNLISTSQVNETQMLVLLKHIVICNKYYCIIYLLFLWGDCDSHHTTQTVNPGSLGRVCVLSDTVSHSWRTELATEDKSRYVIVHLRMYLLVVISKQLIFHLNLHIIGKVRLYVLYLAYI